MPDGMRSRIGEAARANNRSMNAEIIARLEASFSSAIPAGLLQRVHLYGLGAGLPDDAALQEVIDAGLAVLHGDYTLTDAIERAIRAGRPFSYVIANFLEDRRDVVSYRVDKNGLSVEFRDGFGAIFEALPPPRGE